MTSFGEFENLLVDRLAAHGTATDVSEYCQRECGALQRALLGMDGASVDRLVELVAAEYLEDAYRDLIKAWDVVIGVVCRRRGNRLVLVRATAGGKS